MARIPKRIVTAVCAATVLLLVIAAGAHLYLATDRGSRWLSGMINTLYPGEITGSAIEVSLLRQLVTVHDVILRGADKKTIARAEQASLTIDLPALLRQDVILETIDLKKPVFVMELGTDGRLNIEAAFSEDTPEESPYNVYIRKLTCTGGTFVYQGESGNPVVRLEDLDLVMDSAFEHDTLMHFTSPRTRISLFVSGRRIDLGKGSASCEIFNDEVRDIRAWTARGTSRATLSGTITDMAKKAQFHLDLMLDGDMADLREALLLGPETKGTVKGTIAARGDYDDPDFDFALSYGPGTLDGLVVGASHVEGTVTGRVATIGNLTFPFASGTMAVTGTVDLRRLFPEGYFEGIKEEDALAYDLSIIGTSLVLGDIPGLPKGLQGRISPVIDLKGSGTSSESVRIQAAFRARAEGVKAGAILDREPLDMQGRISFHRDVLDIPGLTAQTQAVAASFAGTVHTDARTVAGTVTLDVPRAAPLFKRAGIQGQADLKATVRISGPWDRPAADIAATARDASIEGITLGSIDLRAMLENNRLTIDSCTLANRESRINAQGNIQVFRSFPELESDPVVDLGFDLSQVNPADFSKDLPLVGTLSGRIATQGRLKDLSAEIALTGQGLSYQDYRLGDAELKGSLSKGVITVTDLALTNRKSLLNITGDAAIMDPMNGRLITDPAMHLSVRGQDLAVEDFTDMAKGTFSVNADLEGTIRRPTGKAEIAARDLDLGFQRFASLDLSARSDGDIIWIDPAVLRFNENENINAKGSITLGGVYEFSLGTPGIRMESLDLVKRYDSARGTVFLHATGQGNLSDPAFSGRIAAADITFMDKPLDDMTFAFELKDHALTVEGNWNFRLNARHDLRTGELTAEALFAETELAPMFTLAGRTTLSGRLTGRMDVRGNVHSLRTMDIIADISSLDISHEGADIVSTRNASASFQHGVVTIPKTRLTFAQRGWFDIQGQGELKKDLRLDAEGVVPFDVLGLFSEDLSEGSGLIRVSSQSRFRTGRPDVSARFTLEDLAWTLPVNGQRLHSINGTVVLKDNLLTIEGMTGRLDSGSFQLGGTAALQGFTPKDVELLAQMKSLPIAVPDMMDLTIDAEASLEVRGLRSRLWADAVILDGVYYRETNVNLLTGVFDRILPRQQRQRQKGDVLPMPWPFMETMALDVTVKRRGEVKVENNIADLELNPDMKITGTWPNPVLNGRIAVTDGVVTFQNNDFTVSKGVIDFLDPNRTKASVDISAKTKVRDWDITLKMEGELDNLQITLSSVPAEEPAEILSLLIIGKTSRELTQEKSGVSVSPSGMMAELVASTYGTEIKKATTLDILSITGSDFSSSGGGESLKLTVGKELSRRMTLKYEMETRNTETIQRAIAEYKILENLLVNGYQGTDGSFGTDMIYRYEFR